VRSSFHAFHVLKTATPELRKANVSKCERELVHSICECVLNVLNGNVRLSDCVARKLRKHRTVLRKVAVRRNPISSKKCSEACSCCSYWAPWYPLYAVSFSSGDFV